MIQRNIDTGRIVVSDRNIGMDVCMKILMRLMQEIVGIPDELKSPALADRWVGTVLDHLILPAAFDEINCIGVGYTDATEITLTIYDAVNTFSRTVAITQQQPFQNGLYLIEPFTPDIKVLSFDDKYASFDDGKLLLLQDITYLRVDTTAHHRAPCNEYRTLGVSHKRARLLQHVAKQDHAVRSGHTRRRRIFWSIA